MITLKLFTENDTDTLTSWIDTENMMLQWGGPLFAYPPDRLHMQRHLIMGNDSPPANLVYKAVDENGQSVGHGEICVINYKHRTATLCRILIGPPEMRGRGFGIELIKCLLHVGFDMLHLHRIDLKVYEHNLGAIRCYEKAGFMKEGLMRHVLHVNGVYWNSYVMSILKHEWKNPS